MRRRCRPGLLSARRRWQCGEPPPPPRSPAAAAEAARPGGAPPPRPSLGTAAAASRNASPPRSPAALRLGDPSPAALLLGRRPEDRSSPPPAPAADASGSSRPPPGRPTSCPGRPSPLPPLLLLHEADRTARCAKGRMPGGAAPPHPFAEKNCGEDGRPQSDPRPALRPGATTPPSPRPTIPLPRSHGVVHRRRATAERCVCVDSSARRRHRDQRQRRNAKQKSGPSPR